MIETGARTEDYGEHVEPPRPHRRARPQARGPAAAPEQRRAGGPRALPRRRRPPRRAPARRSRCRPADESRDERRARKEREKEQRRKARAKEQQKGAAGVEPQQKQRGAVTGFIASCWAELKKVQWPDRDTLVQASAVTIIFVVVMAAYLGALDAAFNWLVKQILL